MRINIEELACARASAGQFWGATCDEERAPSHPITHKTKSVRDEGPGFGAEAVLSTVCTAELSLFSMLVTQ